MVLYTVTGHVGEAGYLDIANSGDLTGKNIYVNMTNRCPCNCVFCLRQTKKMMEGNSLWLKEGEPNVDQVMDLFAPYDLSVINELIFCGYGEPLERVADVCEVIDRLKSKYPDLKVRPCETPCAERGHDGGREGDVRRKNRTLPQVV